MSSPQGVSKPLQKKCKPLYDYSSFIDRINVNQKIHKMNINQSVDEAVDWACEQNLLEGYIKEQKAEVKAMLLTEYDEEAHIKLWRNEGRQQMAEEAAVRFLKMNKVIYTIKKQETLLFN